MAYEQNELSSLKPGDQVIVHHRFYGPSVRTVERLTKTYVITSKHERFRISNGFEVNTDKYTPTFITIATPEDIEAINLEKKRTEIVREIELTDWSNLTINQLEQILTILKSSKDNGK